MNFTGNVSTAHSTSFCDQPTKPWFVVYTIFLVLILLGTLFGNGLVVLSVFMFARLRRVSNFFIVSLAVSDLLVALASLPLRIDQSVHNMNWCLPNNACIFWVTTDGVWSAASICNLTIISIDRFLAITKPFVYQEKMSKKVYLTLITIVWCYAVLWGLLSVVNWTTGVVDTNWTFRGNTGEVHCGKNDLVYYTATLVFAVLLPLAIIIISYTSIFKVALAQSKTLASHNPNKRGHKRTVRELKATKTIAIVIGAFVVCWLPFFIIVTIAVWCPVKCFQSFAKYPELSFAIRIPFVFVLPILNSSINPIIYGMYNKEFKAAFRKLLFSDKRHFGVDYLEEYSCNDNSNLRRTTTTDSNSNRRTNINGTKM